MGLFQELTDRYRDHAEPFLLGPAGPLRFADLVAAAGLPTTMELRPGAVVAVIGDFSPRAIRQLIQVVEEGGVVVPLTPETRPDHDYFFQAAGVDWVVEGDDARRLRQTPLDHPLLQELRRRQHPGLILFSTGTTGRPKAILHDFHFFLARYRTPRPTLRTIAFLMFDHIGGVNTLFHTLFNRGCLITPPGRGPDQVMATIAAHGAELLPTSPTFLRLLLLSGELERGVPPSLKLVTYGTERMDQGTLQRLCAQMTGVDFRQTYGMSELSILRVKSKARDSLWMQVGGEGVRTRVEEGILKIFSATRMLGYLNAPSPFDAEGWYDTRDLVEQDGPYLRIVGRQSDVINVGGLKVLPAEIESVALAHPGVLRVKVRGVDNPLTGQLIELTCQLRPGVELTRTQLREFLQERLPEAKRPHRIRIGPVTFNHRFKQN
ncbi:MAG: long-chain fatty acid--CoA ligase [Magnetococcales bacterium]|nr:long-chain fatty acid--CoA ligase [Magnetococcales bacterium]